MLVRPAEQSFHKGLEALAQREGVRALAMFEAAIRLDRQFRNGRPQPRYLSYYGLCLGIESHRWKEAVDLCREAVASESYNPDLHLNLGRVLMAAGRRKEAWMALRRGLELDDQHEGLQRAVAAIAAKRRAASSAIAGPNPWRQYRAHQSAAQGHAASRAHSRRSRHSRPGSVAPAPRARPR